MTKKRSTARQTAPKKNNSRGQQLDGAQYHISSDRPYKFMAGEDGIRPGQSHLPEGSLTVDLRNGISGYTIPPRFIWEEGDWAGSSGDDFFTWVVSGEGTPGNYKERRYKVPQKIATSATADHPADWPESEKKSKSGYSSWGGSKSESLPWGLRIRCLGCGHFFKEDALKNHVNSACPAKQGDLVLWIIECECHPDNILAACEVLPGFPRKPPGLPSGDKGGGKESSEDGRSPESQGKTGTAT